MIPMKSNPLFNKKIKRFLAAELSVWRLFAVVFLALGVWYLVADIPGHAVVMLFALVLEMVHDFTEQDYG